MDHVSTIAWATVMAKKTMNSTCVCHALRVVLLVQSDVELLSGRFSFTTRTFSRRPSEVRLSDPSDR